MKQLSHQKRMMLALQLAERGRYTVSPNPMVGCIIVKNNKIIGQGFHQYAGESHAEILALDQAGGAAMGATAYVTLEPCCHYGRTPPCTNRLIKAGIKEVYIACLDPNPLVAGKGVQALKNANIKVNLGVCEDEAKKLNAIFFHYMTHKRPFVIAKWAMSLDGKTITHTDDSPVISSAASHTVTHNIRQQVDAVLIGATTAIKDNPLLTVRNRENTNEKVKHPIRIILSSKGNLPLDLNIFHSDMPAKTLVATTHALDSEWSKMAEEKNITVIKLAHNNQGRVDLHALLNELGRMGITSLLVEGGMTLHNNFIEENLVNQFHVYLSPVLIGQLKNKHSLTNLHISPLENDYYFIADNDSVKRDNHHV